MTPTKSVSSRLSPRKLRSSSQKSKSSPKSTTFYDVSRESDPNCARSLVVEVDKLVLKTPRSNSKKRMVDKRNALSTSRKNVARTSRTAKKIDKENGSGSSEEIRTMFKSRRQLDFGAKNGSKSSLNEENCNKMDDEGLSLCQRARASLSTSAPSSLVCRESSLRHVTTFLTAAFAPGRERRRSLYISGPPGTGKTACIRHVLATNKAVLPRNTALAVINCVTSSTSELLARIGRAYGLENCGNLSDLENFVLDGNKRKPLLLVLDEIDQIADKSLLYTLFEWPYLKLSRLVLVGIANALDFTDRLLPRLNLREGLNPARLTFAPYTACEIDFILNSRLSSCRAQSLFRPEAIKFVASKVASVSGDVRMALDVCKRALEQNQQKQQQRVLVENNEVDQVSEVGLPDVARLFDAHFGSQMKKGVTSERQQTLPLQQQLLTVTLLLIDGETTFGKLYETYSRLCSSKGLGACDFAEVISLCSLMENRGLVGTKKPNRQALARDTRIVLRVDAKEVEQSFKDKTLFSNIVNNPQGIVTPKK